MGPLGAGHLPVVFSVVFVAMLGTTYCFSVYRGDVDPVFPYISATGSNRPESCLFGLLLNLCSFLSALLVYLRYSVIVELNRSFDAELKAVNRVALYLGTIGAFGMCLVANFQETAVIVIHLSGAFVCFGFGSIYMLLHAWISHRMVPLYAGRRIANIRTFLAVSGILAFCTASFFGVYAAHVYHTTFPDKPTPRPWYRKDNLPGYEFHVVSAVAEWTLAFINMAYFLSYSREFEKIHCDLRVQPLVGHLDHSPTWGSITSFSATP
uniref:DNA damage-regulated autophagy modulator protein 2 n=1 Tax=Panagrellus redivivus TaxID=6233 RepID=A0A7E4VEM6_PANRE